MFEPHQRLPLPAPERPITNETVVAQLSFPALTPGDFIKSVLASHIDLSEPIRLAVHVSR
jgi:hypothetical protein